MRWLLLPGLDGTGELFAPFVQVLPAGDEARVVRFAPGEVDYEAILERLELPSEGEFMVVAESFSGPLGVMVAARCSRVRGLVLAASFAHNPSRLTFFAPLVRAAPTLKLPWWLLRRFMLGDDASNAECAALGAVLTQLPRSTIAGRLSSVRRVDVRELLASLQTRVLLLRPERDRMIPASTFDTAGVATVTIPNAPHLVLQRAPSACLAAIHQCFDT